MAKKDIPYKVMDSKPLKIVIVGDGMVGKTTLCKSYANKSPYKRPYQPTISETHEISVLIDKIHHPIVLWDTAGFEEWEELRAKDYANADCFILCYAIDNFTSFTNVASKWTPELRKYCPYVPTILVGMKKDLRTPSNFLIKESEGLELKNRIRSIGFTECSSTSSNSLECVFILAVSLILDRRKCRRKFGCLIL